jgi:AcrR family transcriptional regulator
MLCDALVDLMLERGYDALTVQDIIDRANVGRSTFYSHFADKEQLLLGSIGQLRDFLREQGAGRPAAAETAGERRFGFSLAMLQHAQSHRRLYKAITGSRSGPLVIGHMKNMLTELIGEEVAALFRETAAGPVPQEIVVEFVASTFLTVLTWWMDQGLPCPAAEASQIFHRLAPSGLGVLRAG